MNNTGSLPLKNFLLVRKDRLKNKVLCSMVVRCPGIHGLGESGPKQSVGKGFLREVLDCVSCRRSQDLVGDTVSGLGHFWPRAGAGRQAQGNGTGAQSPVLAEFNLLVSSLSLKLGLEVGKNSHVRGCFLCRPQSN